MGFWIALIIIVAAWAITEIIFYFLTSFVRKHFQWFILGSDEIPTLSKTGLEKFIPQGYDPELGWIRKPNTSNEEKNAYSLSKWSINDKGARTNPGFEKKNSQISCYGDSFTFCRQVNDNETWEHFLSQITNSNVQNFGVGNYGIDQSLLRLKREFPKNKTNIVIMGVVPDTISRILSYWKHYYEYGNTFAFKPKFKLENKKLKLLPNKIDEPSKFNKLKNYLKEIQKEDYFYKAKFSKEIIKFPYFFNVLKNFRRNFSILYWIMFIQIKKMQGKDISNIEWNPMRIIMKINLKWRLKLYENEKATSLLIAILKEYVSYSKEQNFKPIFIFLPQKDDVLFIKNNYHFFENFLQQIETIDGLIFIDITKRFLEISNLDKLYSDDNEYGGHLTNKGNQLVARIINETLAHFKP